MFKRFPLVLKYLHEVSFLWIGALLGALLGFLTQIILARNFGPYEYGIFASAFATLTVISSLSTFGVHQFLLKVFGEEGWKGTAWLYQSFRFTLVNSFIVCFLISLWALLGPHEKNFSYLLLIMIPLIFAQAVFNLTISRFQLEQRYKLLALWTPLPHILRFLLILFLLLSAISFELNEVGILFSFSSIILVAIGCFYLRSFFLGKIELIGYGLKPESNISEYQKESSIEFKDILKNTWPFGLSAIFYLIFFQTSVIFLDYLDSPESAGIFNIAFVVMMAIYILPGVIYQQFLMPKIHRWINLDKDKFQVFHHSGNKYMLILGIMIGCLLFLLSPSLISYFFGEAYKEAINILLILSFAVPFKFLSTSMGAPLHTENGMKKNVIALGLAAILNISLNIILIPLFSIYGAAFSTLICEIFLLLLYIRFVDKIIFNK
ncbi:MAG: oligosaccharide flippase family protein [SAR86 cluster bacterium]|nr:oligosaccharide flippase family protein [SAR86 cluster bacterium]